MIETSPSPGAPAAYHDVPPGWDPDPLGRHQLRYWDGDDWTSWVSDFDIIGQDPLIPEPPAAEPASNEEHAVDGASGDTVGDDGRTIGAPAGALELADMVERLVHHLRDLSRRSRRIGTDVELSELAAAALRQARVVQGRPVPDDER
jgi:hypothetical protein